MIRLLCFRFVLIGLCFSFCMSTTSSGDHNNNGKDTTTDDMMMYNAATTGSTVAARINPYLRMNTMDKPAFNHDDNNNTDTTTTSIVPTNSSTTKRTTILHRIPLNLITIKRSKKYKQKHSSSSRLHHIMIRHGEQQQHVHLNWTSSHVVTTTRKRRNLRDMRSVLETKPKNYTSSSDVSNGSNNNNMNDNSASTTTATTGGNDTTFLDMQTISRIGKFILIGMIAFTLCCFVSGCVGCFVCCRQRTIRQEQKKVQELQLEQEHKLQQLNQHDLEVQQQHQQQQNVNEQAAGTSVSATTTTILLRQQQQQQEQGMIPYPHNTTMNYYENHGGIQPPHTMSIVSPTSHHRHHHQQQQPTTLQPPYYAVITGVSNPYHEQQHYHHPSSNHDHGSRMGMTPRNGSSSLQSATTVFVLEEDENRTSSLPVAYAEAVHSTGS